MACKFVAELKQKKLIKELPAGAIEITEPGKKYVREQRLEAADEAF